MKRVTILYYIDKIRDKPAKYFYYLWDLYVQGIPNLDVLKDLLFPNGSPSSLLNTE